MLYLIKEINKHKNKKNMLKKLNNLAGDYINYPPWTLVQLIIKVEILLLIIIVSIAFSPNFLFFLRPLPVLGNSSNQQNSVLKNNIQAVELIKLTNNYRKKENLDILRENDTLTEAAQKKAYDMILHNYFSHSSPTGQNFTSWIIDQGYDYRIAGENLAQDFNDNPAVLQAWQSSPSHNKNLLNPNYTEIGIAVVKNPFTNNIIIVQLLADEK